MKRKLCTTGFLLALQAMIASAQTPESFFPHHVGDRWDYVQYWGGFESFFSIILTKDSVGADGSHNLFYDNEPQPTYRIDTALNVFLVPRFNYLRYKLAADSCQAWNDTIGWAWVASVESASVFFQPTVVKTFRYVGNPCNLGSLEEDRLASGFGLIYTWREPNDITYLRGCIINGDTFGILTSVPPTAEFPREYVLKQNYPNPFNPSTTIEFELPEAALVAIRVYDLLGQHVATLTEGKRSAGPHRVIWDASGLTSGVYFMRLSTQYTTRIRKAILLR